MPELRPYRGDYYLWLYIPSTAAAGIFTALFALGTAVVFWRMIKSSAWFCSVFVLGGLLEVAGYAARAIAENRTEQLMPYVFQSTFILVAPALFAASVYMVLGRTVQNIRAESLSIVPVTWLTTIFVCGDVLSFVVQASGAGVMVAADSISTGENIIIGGLFVQLIIFGLFIITTAVLHKRVRLYGPSVYEAHGNEWEKMIQMLYIVSVLIMLRSVFRVVEYIMGNDGYLLSHEWTLFPGHLSRTRTEADIEMPSPSQHGQKSATSGNK
ncbi:hypothetical protein S40288_07083 [Stachybotrys chartarum IBT 40288]|nr:hypothetical protein S40288_07083 [Stachybotrys chartarum IBT 40288]